MVCMGMALAMLAQRQDNLRVRALQLDGDTVRLDSLSIVPGSFSLWNGQERIPDDHYVLDPFKALLFPLLPRPTPPLTARYRVMPMMLAGPFRHKDPALLTVATGERQDPFRYVPPKTDADLFGMGGLEKSGSISRGILVGNNQDLSVNSALNLELNGKLTDRIGVQASVTDNNIPIQANGNTLELQDFDQVFIKFFDDRQDLTAGDFTLTRPAGHFLNYNKKTKGLSYNTLLGHMDAPIGRLGVSAAVNKGAFERMQFTGTEGVQGPYRLSSTAGGPYIIVLSGTERVYVDGQLLLRGAENDYVIDYNAALLTFTPRRLITKDSRITVEFQWSDKNYARSLLRLTNELHRGGTTLRFNAYSEQDHKNQPLQQTLTDSERAALAQAGDDPLAAVVPGADTVAFNTDETLYAEVDSLGWSPVYLWSTEPDSARYRVVFSVVGAGNGDYVQQSFTPTGRVFQWLAPDTVAGVIVHRGDHAPVRTLVAPKARRMATLGVEQVIDKRTKAWGEAAVSHDDPNTFSSLDDADDAGMAFRAGASHEFRLSATDSSMRIIATNDNEWRSKRFTPIERYRSVEFDRDWNLAAVPQDGDQLFSSTSMALQAGTMGTAALESALFHIDGRFDGFRQALRSDLHLGRTDLALDGSLLEARATSANSSFLRGKGRLARRWAHFTLGIAGDAERNLFHNDSTPEVAAGSYAYLAREVFVQSPDSARIRFNLSAGQREDQALKDGELSTATMATNYKATVDLGRGKVRKLSGTFTYRRLRLVDSSLTAQPAEDTWLASLDHGHSILGDAVSWDLTYGFGSGLEPKQEFIYLQVPAGQGTYVWIDYDGDGVKDLDEFELAPFGYEADYIRTYIQTGGSVRVLSDQLSASMELRPSARWRDNQGLRGFLAKFNDLASYRGDRKFRDGGHNLITEPWATDPADTNLIAMTSAVRNVLYFDRSNRAWSMDHSWQTDRGKSLLLNGQDSRLRESQMLHARWNATSRWMLEGESTWGRTLSNSDDLLGRTYAITDRSVAPKLTFQPNGRMRTIARFKFSERRNDEDLGGELAEIRDLGGEFRLNSPSKGSFQVNINLVDIAYDGLVDSSLGTEMLNGLKPGTNLTWSAALQRRLSDHLQLDLTYNGRSSPGNAVVHVGGAQVRAFF
jgi:hypothetical protein